MTIRNVLLACVCAAALLATTTARAADTKTYQVSGPVLEVTPTSVTVQKGSEKWQLTRDANTKVTGDLKVGSKVTVYYKMIATDIEVKGGKSEGKAEGKNK